MKGNEESLEVLLVGHDLRHELASRVPNIEREVHLAETEVLLQLRYRSSNGMHVVQSSLLSPEIED